MQNSGTKLVLALVGMALLLGSISWWYRYETARRASQFWGPEAARLIAQSEQFEIVVVPEAPPEEDPAEQRLNLTQARGQAHLRHAFMTDSNYVWDEPLTDQAIQWRWRLRFHEENREAWVYLSEDLKAIGKPSFTTADVAAFSCQPMTTSLTAYFQALDLLEKPNN